MKGNNTTLFLSINTGDTCVRPKKLTFKNILFLNNFTKDCKTTTESLCMPSTQVPVMSTTYIPYIAQLSKPGN